MAMILHGPGWRLLLVVLSMAMVPAQETAASREAATRELVARAMQDPAGLRSQPPAANPGPILLAKDFGLSTTATPAANAAALAALGRALTGRHAAGVRFDAGDYIVQLHGGSPALLLEGLSDFTVEGHGARLLMRDAQTRGPRIPGFLVIRGCRRLLVEDLALVWDWEDKPMCVVGRITEVTADRVRYQVVSGGTLQGSHVIRGGREWDPGIANRSPRGYAASFREPARILDGQTLEFRGRPAGRPAVGMCSLLRIEENAEGHGVALEDDNDHLTFDRLQIRGAPADAMAGQTGHLWIRRSVLAPPRDGWFKASHDGFRIRADWYVFEDNHVSYCHDDVMNFEAGHRGGMLGGGVLPDGVNSLIADRLQHYASKDDIYAGAEYFLADRAFAPQPWRSRITAFDWQLNYHPASGKDPANRCRITFADAVPAVDASRPRDLLLMLDRCNRGAYLIRGNTFTNNLCHGIWAGNGPGVIEDNRFFQTGYPAIGVLMTIRWERWYKGFYPTGIIIRGNRLERCNTALRQPADLYVGAAIDDQRDGFVPCRTRVARQVIIEDNEIRESSQAALGVFAAEDVSLIGNRIFDPGRASLVDHPVADAALFILHARDVRLRGNRITGDAEGSVHGVRVIGSEQVTGDGQIP